MPKTLGDWQAVASAVLARRIELGYQNRKEACEATRVGTTPWNHVENGRGDEVSEKTLYRIALGLEWPADALQRIAAGDPVPEGRATQRRLADLERRLARVEAILEQIRDARGASR